MRLKKISILSILLLFSCENSDQFYLEPNETTNPNNIYYGNYLCLDGCNTEPCYYPNTLQVVDNMSGTSILDIDTTPLKGDIQSNGRFFVKNSTFECLGEFLDEEVILNCKLENLKCGESVYLKN